MNFYKVALPFVFSLHLSSSHAQLSFIPSGKNLASDTANPLNPAVFCWNKSSVRFRSSGIASVPGLSEIEVLFSNRIRAYSWGAALNRNGTDFLNTTQLHALMGYRSGGISGGITSSLHQYYAKEYYTLYRVQISLSSMARLMKGKWWFAMNMNNFLPSASSLVKEVPMLQLSSSYALAPAFRIGGQYNWRAMQRGEFILWKELRWNKYIAHQLFYNVSSKSLSLLASVSYLRHTWQGGGTLFYQPGFIWSCAYIYSF